jgi:hypothetical protein
MVVDDDEIYFREQHNVSHDNIKLVDYDVQSQKDDSSSINDRDDSSLSDEDLEPYYDRMMDAEINGSLTSNEGI